MKFLKILLLSLFLTCLLLAPVLAAGNAGKGKILFNDPTAFGGRIACSTCHPGGRGLEKAGSKSEWITPAGRTGTLEEAINLCIVNANRGHAIDVRSEQMIDMVAYIKSIGKLTEK